MNVLAIPATNSINGLNYNLLSFATKELNNIDPETVVEFVDLNDYEMPIYSPQREEESGVHTLAQQLFDKIGAADAVIISFAEYNGTYTSAWKNVHDWMSRIEMGIYQGKPLVMLAASPGPRGGAGVLEAATATAPFFGAELVGHLGIGTFYDNFDMDAGKLTNGELAAQMTELLHALVGTTTSR